MEFDLLTLIQPTPSLANPVKCELVSAEEADIIGHLSDHEVWPVTPSVIQTPDGTNQLTIDPTTCALT